MDAANVGYSYNLPSAGWNYKFRSTMSQFSEIFSEFNKYIAPAYHHDRCERSVQMRIYSMHKGEFVMIIIGYFAFLGLGAMIGEAGPPISKTNTISGTSLNQSNSTSNNVNSKWPSEPFHLHSKPTGNRLQQLWLSASIHIENKDEELVDKIFVASVSVEGVLEDHTSYQLYTNLNRTHHLHCEKSICSSILLLHISSLEYTHYAITVTFFDLDKFHKMNNIQQIYFVMESYSETFIQMQTWFRFIFLMATFAITCWLFHLLRAYAVADWSLEQKLMTVMLTLLLLYNDPLYPLGLVSDSSIPPALDSVLQHIFMASMLFSWLTLYHGFRQNERRLCTFYIPKVLFDSSLFIPMLIVDIWRIFYPFQDPTYNYLTDPSYQSLKIAIYVSLSGYAFYLILLMIRAYADLKNMPYFEARLRCASLSVVCGSILLLLKYRSHTSSEPYGMHLQMWHSSVGFMCHYTGLNLLIYFLAYMYSPSSKPPHESSITKDNPAFSMINDSDEEVIYGSDEDSRRLLTTRRADIM